MIVKQQNLEEAIQEAIANNNKIGYTAILITEEGEIRTSFSYGYPTFNYDELLMIYDNNPDNRKGEPREPEIERYYILEKIEFAISDNNIKIEFI